MRGAHPKPGLLRQRRNKKTSNAHLPSVEQSADNLVPQLFNRGRPWHPRTLEWWQSVWQSPMSGEYLAADTKGGLYLLAELYDARWTTEDPVVLLKLSAEIRLQEPRFGLTPLDRSRLQWNIEQGDTAAERTESRREKRRPTKAFADPRSVLKAI